MLKTRLLLIIHKSLNAIKNYSQGFVTQVIIAATFLAKLSPMLDFNETMSIFLYFVIWISFIFNLLGGIHDYLQKNLENQSGIHELQ